MKKLYNLLLLSVCLPMFLSSCLGDLDTVPLTDDKLLPEKAWEDPNAYEQFLAKIYAGLTLSEMKVPSGFLIFRHPTREKLHFCVLTGIFSNWVLMKWFVPKIMRPCEDCSSVSGTPIIIS